MEKMLKKYASLIVGTGVNVQKGEEVYVNAPIVAAKFALAVAEAAYKRGAKKVTLIYNDELFTKLRYENEQKDVLAEVEAWHIARMDNAVEKRAAYISILAEDPMLLSKVDPDLIAAVSKARRTALKKFYDATMSNQIKWCIAAHPSEAWAKKIFPKESPEKAVEKLWEMIFAVMRLEGDDPVKAWEKHVEDLGKRSKFLNKHRFASLRYKNSIGTDFTVGLPDDYVFMGGGDKAANGCVFIANMPTEEVFSAPHKDKAEGKLVSSMPLVFSGSVIDNFSLTFKGGKVVDFSAEKGYDVLKNLLDTDEGMRRLGEVALVQYDSPISNLKTLFYNTLFDENASCHFALGRAYPSCVKNGDDLPPETLAKMGLNSSIEHVDFMIGTKDLSIVGIKADGSEIEIFKNGNFVI